MRLKNYYFELKDLEPSRIFHSERGIGSFDPLKSSIQPLRSMMLKMGEILDGKKEIPDALFERAEGYIEVFYDNMVQLKDFTVTDDNNTLQAVRSLIAQYKSLFDAMLSGRKSNVGETEDFLTVYNAVLSYDNKYEDFFGNVTNLNSTIEERVADVANQLAALKEPYEANLNEVENIKQRHQEILNSLEQSGKEKTTEDYAAIFSEEADKNKGQARIYMTIFILTLILFAVFLRYEDIILPVDFNHGSTVITLDYVRRLLATSFLIFILVFLLRQFSVRKHLQTLNTHRQNTLQSYKLFLQSMGSASEDISNALMVEVARAIYETGSTGFISNKDDQSSVNSITEITKYLNKS